MQYNIIRTSEISSGLWCLFMISTSICQL